MAGRKVALITDTHFGVRKGSQIFHEYFQEFYRDTFFKALDEHNIDTVVHLGDCFDVRKGIDYWSLDWAKTNFFDPLQQKGIELHLIVGNHDIFYRDNLSINSPVLNLREYDNISIYARPETANIKGTNIFMVPWICTGNADKFAEELDATSADVCMGHLELAGFYANKDYQCQHGTDPKVFKKFSTVFSGHFHKKSTRGNITYLGNPYQLYWNDEGDIRGINPTRYKDSYVKVIVEGSSSPIKLNRVVDKLYDVGIHDIKIVENIDISIDDDVEVEAEDTLTTLTNYVNAMEDVNRDSVITIFKSLYVEAQEV